jgi:hypothetical protein
MSWRVAQGFLSGAKYPRLSSQKMPKTGRVLDGGSSSRSNQTQREKFPVSRHSRTRTSQVTGDEAKSERRGGGRHYDSLAWDGTCQIENRPLIWVLYLERGAKAVMGVSGI